MRGTLLIPFTVATFAIPNFVFAQSQEKNVVPVTVDSFVRAESDMYLGNMLKDSSLGKFGHRRKPSSIDNQTLTNQNRDTLYSAAVFDLEAGPATITLPDDRKHFMSMQIVNEDHYVPMLFYGPGSYTLDQAIVGTRYSAAVIRIVVDPADANEVKQGIALQDAIKVDQPGPGKFDIPNWDQVSQKRMRDALIMLGSSISDFKKAFGQKEQVDPVRHLIGTALAWGSSPVTDATYRNITPGRNDGVAIHKLILKDVPPDLFWSIGIFNAQERSPSREENNSSLCNATAQPGKDGSIVVQFGGCDGRIPNCLSIMPHWTYTVRVYRPRTESRDDKWLFPQAQAVP